VTPITAIEAIPLRLPFREEFRIARGSVGDPHQGAPHVYVRVADHEGAEGWGEARPSHRWSYETEESVLTTIRHYLAPALIGRDAWDLRGLHAAMEAQIAPGISIGAPIAKSGIDVAVHDLLARRAGVPLDRFLGGGEQRALALTCMVSVATPDEAARRVAQAWSEGFRGFKVKIGRDPARDLEVLRAARAAAPGAFLWADANQAYDVATAVTQAGRMEALGVDCLEQPVPANDWSGMARVARGSALPIAADESVFSAEDLLQLIRLEACDILVVKVAKMAGLHRARQAIDLARAAGLGILGSGLTESRLGLAAAVHLLAAGGGCRFADLNGPQFLAADPVSGGIDVRPGSVEVPTGPGTGVTLDPERLARYRSR
jgi:muconate cycloisomerase